MRKPPQSPLDTIAAPLIQDVRQLIEASRQRVATSVNTELSLLYWQIGRRIDQENLTGERAEYGQEIVATLSQQLSRDYGSGFSRSGLARMIKFSQHFSDIETVKVLAKSLSWSHFKRVIAFRQTVATGVLRRAVSGGALERTHPAQEN